MPGMTEMFLRLLFLKVYFYMVCKLFTELIGAEGARSSKMHSHFLREPFTQGSLINVQRE
ncbi:hypothetical protein C1N70_11670 [Cytobacillus firmus]